MKSLIFLLLLLQSFIKINFINRILHEKEKEIEKKENDNMDINQSVNGKKDDVIGMNNSKEKEKENDPKPETLKRKRTNMTSSTLEFKPKAHIELSAHSSHTALCENCHEKAIDDHILGPRFEPLCSDCGIVWKKYSYLKEFEAKVIEDKDKDEKDRDKKKKKKRKSETVKSIFFFFFFFFF